MSNICITIIFIIIIYSSRVNRIYDPTVWHWYISSNYKQVYYTREEYNNWTIFTGTILNSWIETWKEKKKKNGKIMTKGNLTLAEVQMYTHRVAIFYPSSGIGNENGRIETKSRGHEKAKKNEIGTRIRCTFPWFFVRALPVWNESHPLKISMAGSVRYFWISRFHPFTIELCRLFVTEQSFTLEIFEQKRF